MEMEQVKKVVRLNENSIEIEAEANGGGDDERNDSEPSDMDKLPNEIFMKILRYLSNNQLLQYRIVNSRWNEICCILHIRRKPDFTVRVIKQRGKGLECSTVITRDLDDFLQCFALSEADKLSGRRRPCPCLFSHFNIQGLYYMRQTDMCELAFTFGPQIKIIHFDIKGQDVPIFPKIFKLLLHFARNIEHLGISGTYALAGVSLFDEVSDYIDKYDSSIKPLSLNNTFLKNLKIFEIKSQDIGRCCIDRLMETILMRTPNIQQVMIHNPYFGTNSDKGILPWNVVEVLRNANLLNNSKVEVKYVPYGNHPNHVSNVNWNVDINGSLVTFCMY